MRALAGGVLALLVGTGVSIADAGVVSLDYCADQYVLALMPRQDITAVSPDAGSAFSYLRDEAGDIPRVRPVAEDVIVLAPDIVVRTYGGGPRALQFFERAGISVVQVPYANDIEGIRESIGQVAGALGARARGAELVARMDRRLAAVGTGRDGREALYLTPGGATSGPGTLVHEMLLAAGLANFEHRPGWHTIPLEKLAYEKPDVVVYAAFGNASESTAYWSSMRHPVARRMLSGSNALHIEGAWTACGGWFLLDAIESLAQAEYQ